MASSIVTVAALAAAGAAWASTRSVARGTEVGGFGWLVEVEAEMSRSCSGCCGVMGSDASDSQPCRAPFRPTAAPEKHAAQCHHHHHYPPNCPPSYATVAAAADEENEADHIAHRRRAETHRWRVGSLSAVGVSERTESAARSRSLAGIGTWILSPPNWDEIDLPGAWITVGNHGRSKAQQRLPTTTTLDLRARVEGSSVSESPSEA